MKFRTKFGLQGWVLVSLGVLYSCMWSTRRGNLLGILAAGFVLQALVRGLSHAFYYWELNADGLRQRNFWRVKTIPWEEVTWVGSAIPKQPSSGFLQVDYARPAPMSDRGQIRANPDNREQFIRTMRKYAPQATFEA
jgi:hypothetical protein